MNVYEVEWDGVRHVVAAPSFGDAVALWRAHLVAESKREGTYEEADDDREPDQVILRSDVEGLLIDNPTREG